MSSTHRRAQWAAVLPVLAVLAGLSLAGCGSGSGDDSGGSSSRSATATATPTPEKTPSGAELYARARTSALAAKSGRVRGEMVQDGESMTIDLFGLSDGTNQSFTMSVGTEGRATMLTVGGKTLMSADETFWTTQLDDAELAKLFVGKYVSVPAADAEELGRATLKDLLSELFAEKELTALEGANTRVEKATVDGQEVFTLQERVGGDGSSIVVSADGTATLLRIVGPKDSPGTLEFTEWNAVKPVAAPAAKDVITMPE